MSVKGKINMFNSYLKKFGVPKNTCEHIIEEILYEAVQEAKYFQYDRIYTAVAASNYRAYDNDTETIVRQLEEFDKIFGEVNDGKYWDEVMNELKEKRNLVIATDEDNRILLEYRFDGERSEKECVS